MCLYNKHRICVNNCLTFGKKCFRGERLLDIRLVCRQIASETRRVIPQVNSISLNSHFPSLGYDPRIRDIPKLSVEAVCVVTKYCCQLAVFITALMSDCFEDSTTKLAQNSFSLETYYGPGPIPERFVLGRMAAAFPQIQRLEIGLDVMNQLVRQALYFLPRLSLLVISLKPSENNRDRRKSLLEDVLEDIWYLRDRGLKRYEHLVQRHTEHDFLCVGYPTWYLEWKYRYFARVGVEMALLTPEEETSPALDFVRHVNIVIREDSEENPLKLNSIPTGEDCTCGKRGVKRSDSLLSFLLDSHGG